jgi:hypothetical protein
MFKVNNDKDGEFFVNSKINDPYYKDLKDIKITFWQKLNTINHDSILGSIFKCFKT